jgi:hypothetical protein
MRAEERIPVEAATLPAVMVAAGAGVAMIGTEGSEVGGASAPGTGALRVFVAFALRPALGFSAAVVLSAALSLSATLRLLAALSLTVVEISKCC